MLQLSSTPTLDDGHTHLKHHIIWSHQIHHASVSIRRSVDISFSLPPIYNNKKKKPHASFTPLTVVLLVCPSNTLVARHTARCRGVRPRVPTRRYYFGDDVAAVRSKHPFLPPTRSSFPSSMLYSEMFMRYDGEDLLLAIVGCAPLRGLLFMEAATRYRRRVAERVAKSLG